MIRTDGAANLGAIGSLNGLGVGVATDASPERFGDFSRIVGQASGQVGLGRTSASADPAHAARAVVSCVLQD
jgi:hypothetical protein